MRSLYTLYGILIENESKRDLSNGICRLIFTSYCDSLISYQEKFKLSEHFRNQKPNENKKWQYFTLSEYYTGSTWWWKCNKGGKEQRLLFLKTLQQDVKPWWKKVWWV